MDQFVPDYAIDTEEVFARGGRNFGDEEFALFKCPGCSRVYLIDNPAEVVYPDPDDLGVRLPADSLASGCAGCGRPMSGGVWCGSGAPQPMRVTWDRLRATRWAWVATVEIMLHNQKRMMREAGL